MRTHALFFAAVFGLALARLGAADIPKTSTAPPINGRPAPAWEQAARFTFTPYNPAKPVVMGATAALAYDDRCLYIAVHCRETNLVEARQQPKLERHDAPAWENDCIEIFLDTLRNGKSYYQFVIDIHGATADLRHYDPAWPGPALDWNGAWQHAVGDDEDGWLAQAAIPWTTIGLSPGPERQFSLNISRVRRIAPFERSVLAPTRRLHDLENFLVVTGLDLAAPPVAGHFQQGAAYRGRNRMTVRLHNREALSARGELILTILAADGHTELLRQTIPAILPAEAEQTFELTYLLEHAGTAQVKLDFTAANGDRHPIDAGFLVFRQPLEWADPSPIATAGKDCPVLLRCFSAASVPERALDLAIIDSAGNTVAEQGWSNLPDRGFLELPSAELKPGRYTVKAALRHGADRSESSLPLLVTPDLTAP